MVQSDNKSFSDWLVVSDIDGTLNNKIRKLPSRNYNAIKHFMNDLGGNFTLASGRSVITMRKHYERLDLNAPAVILNGAGIYDFRNEKMLDYTEVGEIGIKIVGLVLRRFPMIEVMIVANDRNYLINSHIFAPIMSGADELKTFTYSGLDEVPKEEWGKVIFLGMPVFISQLKKYLLRFDGKGVSFMSSSVSSFEMLNDKVNKGIGALKVADYLGVDRSKTAAIGDYFNDYELLKHVALPACCGQAPRKMKEISKLVCCHCNKGAVADLLEYIEQNY
jgi:Cof subfamily protein (haloacid dehalogenase superfamily)